MWKLIFFVLLAWIATVAAEEVDLLVYAVKEEGLPKYLSRILVSDAFVRLDEGAASSNGYTLYNRVSHVLYNVDPEEETVLVLQPSGQQPRSPESLRLDEKLAADPDAGLRELRLALARLQGEVSLEGNSDACELAEYVYAPTRALEHGLPLVDLMQGKQQWLVDFDSPPPLAMEQKGRVG